MRRIDRNTGHPFASLVNVATDVDGSPLILVSRLSTHTANLEVDGRASLLLASTGKGDPLAHPRLTLLGSFAQIARDDPELPRIRRRFLARHPKSELYAGFADFSFWRLNVVSAHLNGGFARAADLKAADVMTDIADAEDLIDAEEGAVTHMNDDHAEAVRLYATKLLGAEDGRLAAHRARPRRPRPGARRRDLAPAVSAACRKRRAVAQGGGGIGRQGAGRLGILCQKSAGNRT